MLAAPITMVIGERQVELFFMLDRDKNGQLTATEIGEVDVDAFGDEALYASAIDAARARPATKTK